MPMSPLASQIYIKLKGIQPSGKTLSYKEFIQSTGLPTHWRDPKFHDALGEIVIECRRLGIPALAALVVRSKARTPGGGYYPLAHPGAKTPADQVLEWQQELAAVQAATYP